MGERGGVGAATGPWRPEKRAAAGGDRRKGPLRSNDFHGAGCERHLLLGSGVGSGASKPRPRPPGFVARAVLT